jgi:hypothetical protein
MEQQALFLKLAGHIGHSFEIAVGAFVLAGCVFAFLLRAKRTIAGCFAAVVIVLLGVTPYFASKTLESRGVYHVQIILLRPDQTVADIAQVKSSNGGEVRMAAGGWELDIPQQARPADGKLTLTAAVKDEFLNGQSTVVLAEDYYPTVTVQLVADTSAKIRGVVVDEDFRAIAGATVSIDGSADVAMSDAKGNFVLPAHAGKGQMVEVSARKGALKGTLSAPAGKVIEVILSQQ